MSQLPPRPVTRLDQNKKSVENPNHEEHSEDEDEYWNLPVSQREDLLRPLDLLADQLSGDVPSEHSLTQHNIVEENVDVDTDDGVDTIQEQQVTEQTQLLPDGTVVNTGLEGGEPPSTSAEPVCDYPARRQVKPVVRLSYDRPGHPTDKPSVVVHRGLRLIIKRDSLMLCQSWDNV